MDDDPIPASFNAESFDAFQSADTDDDNGFDVFQVAPSKNISNEFDAFGSMQPSIPPPPPPPPQHQQHFDAFGSAASSTQPSFDAFASGPSNVHDIFGNMSVSSSNNNTVNTFVGGAKVSIMGGGSMTQKHQEVTEDDEFGDFDDGKSSKKVSSDPLANLISLDSLSKNKKKHEDKTNEPIAFNEAAKQYIQKGAPVKPVTMSKEAANMAFSGVDGLPKHNTAPMMHMNGMNYNSGQKPSVMMSSGGLNSNTIDSVFPDLIAQRSQMQHQRMMMMQQQQHFQMSGMSTVNTTMNISPHQDPNNIHNNNTGDMGSFTPMGGQSMGAGDMRGQAMHGWH